jgi:adenosylcobinamide-GDP ribazoletransferase
MPSLRDEAAGALAAVTFLTRLPVPGAGSLGAEDVRRAGAYFPAVGALLGGAVAASAGRGSPALAVGTGALLTGALHLDALADAADALGVTGRDRTLEVMRDSRIGSFGAVAIGLDLLLRTEALARADAGRCVAAGALSRCVPVVLAAALPYARDQGTGGALTRGSAARAAAAFGVAGGVSLLSGARNPRHVGVFLRRLILATSVGAASGLFWRRRIGGVTGDTLGAALELTELAILLWG